LLQRHDGRARTQRRGIRNSHDLSGQRRIGLDELGELCGIGDLPGGELRKLGADAGKRRNGLRRGERLGEMARAL